MRRKIIELGNNCMVMSLPIKWIRRQNLHKGDEIEVTQDGPQIILGSKKREEPRKTKVDIPQLSLLIRRYLVAVYRGGYDEVRLNFSEPEIIKEVQKTTNEMLIGYEIVDQGKDFCVLRTVASGFKEEFEPMLRRAFIVTLTMGKNSLEAIKQSDYDQLKESLVLETTNNKLTLFCQRIINKTDYKEVRMATFMFTLVHQLEKIADEYKFICDYVASNKIKVSKKVIGLYENVNLAFKMLQNIVYNFKKEGAEEIAKLRKKIMKESELLYKKVDKKEIKIIVNLVNITQYIFNILGCQMGLVL